MNVIRSPFAIFRLKVPQAFYEWFYDFKWKQLYRLGLLKGFWQFMRGRVVFEDSYHPFILGSRVKFLMQSGGEIIIRHSSNYQEQHGYAPSIPFYPSATSLGVTPYWRLINPVIAQRTHLRVQQNAQIILGTNCNIQPGAYLSVWPEKQLLIKDNVQIGHGVIINTACGIEIGQNVLMSHHVVIMDYDGHPVFENGKLISNERYGGSRAKISIADNVWIGANVTILKGVNVGQNSIIAANSCVTKDVPKNTIVAGNPAKVVKTKISWERF